MLVCAWVCGLLDVDPQPVNASKNRQAHIRRTLRNLLAKPNQKKGSGETRASTNPEVPGVDRLLLLVLTVIFVLCGVPPDSVAGAKPQPQPLGRPEQANVSEALNPFCGATETVNEPVAPCDIESVLLDSVSP